VSNYLTVVLPRRLEDRFLEWLRPHLPEGPPRGELRAGVGSPEHLIVELPGTTARLHHIARSAAADLLDDGMGGPAAPGHSGALFRGYAQSRHGEQVVFGAAGVRALSTMRRPGGGPVRRSGLFAAAPGQEWDGSHLAVRWDRGYLRAHTDFFRTLPLLYTSGVGMTALSDSWQVLVRLRTALGMPVSLSPQALMALRIDRSITEHPMDAQTVCSQVRLASVATHVVAPIEADEVGPARVEQTPYPEAFRTPEGSWSHVVRQAAVTMASTMKAFAEQPGITLRLSVSGGADSRAVLAAMRRADPDQQVSVLSTANRGGTDQRDFEVVHDLARRTGILVGHNPAAPMPTVIPYPHPFATYLVGSLGIHQRINIFPGRVGGAGHFTLTGHGAGVFKTSYGWRPFWKVARDLNGFDSACGPVAGRLGKGFLTSVGVDPDAPDASEWHFIGLRNSLHGGRFTLTNLLGYPPLMQRDLTSLAHLPADAATSMPAGLRRDAALNAPRPNTTMSAVLLTLLDQELSSIPFDDPAKDIDPQTRDAILAAAGGPLHDAEIPTAEAFGGPTDVVNGTAETFLSLAESWGQGVEFSHSGITPLVAQGGQIAADLGLADWYRPLIDQAEHLLTTDTHLAHQPGVFGRLMTFLPLSGATVDGTMPAAPSIGPRPRPGRTRCDAAPTSSPAAAPTPAATAGARAGRRLARFIGARPAQTLRRLGGRALRRLGPGRRR
jgi:hypothetical protein